jgi:hypothetical protein
MLCACGAPDEFDDNIKTEFRTSTTSSAITSTTSGTGFIVNGLEEPDISDVDPAYSLSSAEGLSSNSGWLLDSDSLKTARYMVECALPAGESITKVVNGQTIELAGAVGLAPEWEDSECDEDCQEWVSACLLARTNASGAAVSIFVTGEHEAIDSQVPSGLVFEAAFYGNIFADPEGQYLCKGSSLDVVAARRDGRTCSTTGTCHFTAYANCTSFSRCEMTGPNQAIPANCKTGPQATSAPYHTVATFVSPN